MQARSIAAPLLIHLAAKGDVLLLVRAYACVYTGAGECSTSGALAGRFQRRSSWAVATDIVSIREFQSALQG